MAACPCQKVRRGLLSDGAANGCLPTVAVLWFPELPYV